MANSHTLGSSFLCYLAFPRVSDYSIIVAIAVASDALDASRVILRSPQMANSGHISWCGTSHINQSLEEERALIIDAKFLRRFLDRTLNVDNVSANRAIRCKSRSVATRAARISRAIATCFTFALV